MHGKRIRHVTSFANNDVAHAVAIIVLVME